MGALPCRSHLHTNSATKHSAKNCWCNVGAFFQPEPLYKLKMLAWHRPKMTVQVDHLPERLSSSMAVWASCHPLMTPQEFLWSPIKPSASSTVITLQMSTPQEVVTYPGTGAVATAIPGVLQKLQLCMAKAFGGAAACAWMMGLIFESLEKEEKLQHFHMQSLSSCNAPIKLTNLASLLLISEHNDFTRQWIASVSYHKDLPSGEQGSGFGLQSLCKWACWLTKQKLKRKGFL